MSMHLIQILLPLYNNDKEPFPVSFFTPLREELASKFGGVTAYSSAPATGLWKENDDKTVKDKIIVYEVMTDELDRQWWLLFRKRIELVLQQEEVVIRAIPIQRL